MFLIVNQLTALPHSQQLVLVISHHQFTWNEMKFSLNCKMKATTQLLSIWGSFN